ncbi:hypothetical protein FN846DRAFT_905447 [Sphaerosporella brunnea]|uniref:Uncharacterized protein n=1 Tax=Sphaerosporella brunnea TaxID=1250544 RepID=A0A5J5F1M0_9PEZI|nr:hypothetical protein FN846DRAFT_905447 [Sphaerosporella brunnea]
MPPKRQRKIEIYADTIDIFTGSPANSSSRPKRKQPDTEAASAAHPPKRQAFGPKSCNSRDTSFRQDDSFLDEKSGVKGSDENEGAGAGNSAKPVSALKTAFQPGNEIRKYLEAHDVDAKELASMVDCDKIQEVADIISKKELWTPSLVSCFADSMIEKLDLNLPASSDGFSIPEFPPAELLAPLFAQRRFTKLTTLNLRNNILSTDDIALLRLLPSLTTLDLCGTGITNMALYNLVCHRHTLTSLNISNNQGITDEARFVFRPLYRLTALFLRGTNISMPALRRLVIDDLPKGCRLLSIPAHAIETINNMQEKYAADIPAGYIEDPSKVEHATMPVLKRNLELHAKFNKDVQVTGTKVELVHRLKALLGNRYSDMRIVAVLGRAN